MAQKQSASKARRATRQPAGNAARANSLPDSTRAAVAAFFGVLLIGSALLLFSPGTPSSGPRSTIGGLSVGSEHGCLIRREYDEARLVVVDTGVWCWGRNDNGELGNGLGGPTAYAENELSKVLPVGAVRVRGLEDPRSVTVVGTDRSCAVTERNELWCWGVRRPIGMERSYWQDSSYGTAEETGAKNRLAPERVMSGVKGFYVYSIDRPAWGVDDLDRYACAIVLLDNGDGVSCWGDGQGEIGADGTRGLGLSPVGVAGLPTNAKILELDLRADRACATVVLPEVEGASSWCWEHRLGVASAIDKTLPLVIETVQGGEAYRVDLLADYGLTAYDEFLSADGQPYCVMPSTESSRDSSLICRGYDQLPFYFRGFWLDTGERLGNATESARTRWFGTMVNQDGGSSTFRPEGLESWNGGRAAATSRYLCTIYRLTREAARDGDPNTDGVYCYIEQAAPSGWPAVAWVERAIVIPQIIRKGADREFLGTTPTIYEIGVRSGVLPDGQPSGGGCALPAEDLLFCWGSNELGALGSGDTTDRPDGYFLSFGLGSSEE